MYIIHIRDLVMDDPYPMYQNITELIEADGEAEQLFLEQVVADQYPSQHFHAIDWKSNDVIDLDIVDYIGQKAFNLFEKVILNTPEDEKISYEKANSWFIACVKAKR